MKKQFVCVTPISSIARNRFIEDMDSFHSCQVKDQTEKLYYLTSLNGQYCFWVQKKGNEHWKVER